MEEIPLEETDIGVIGLSMWRQEFEDITMSLHSFFNQFMQNILLSESTRACHEYQVAYGFSFDLLLVV